MTSKEKQIGKYIILNQELGRGAFAQCKMGCEAENEKNLIAVKIIDKNKLQMQQDKQKLQKELEHIKREINHMKLLDSEHIVRMLDIAQTSNNLYLFLEYCNGGSLDQYLTKKKGKLSEKEALLIFEEISKAFQNMQQNKIIHRDIKPQNILIHNSTIKIADFGFSKMVEDNDQAVMQTMLGNFLIEGTPLYLPIEILTGKEYSSKCDVFSVGIILYELIFGQHPFYHRKKLSGIPSLIHELKNSPLKFPDAPKIDPQVKDLIEHMLGIVESERYSWEDIFQSSYFMSKQKAQQIQYDAMNNENDEFRKAIMQSNMYLDDNLVGGQITKTEKKNNQSKTPTEDQEFDQEANESIQEDVKQIHMKVLFERNIAIFYFNLLRKIWNAQNQKQVGLEESLFYRLLYSLTKMGMLFLQKLTDYLGVQIDKINQDKTTDSLLIYKNTIQFRQDIKLLKNDQITYIRLQNELQTKVKKLFGSKNQEDREIKLFLEILEESYDKKVLKQVLDQTVLNAQQTLGTNYQQMNSEQLLILRYFQILKNPYNTFEFKAKEVFDFHKFYENLEKADAQELIKIIQTS